MTPVAKLFRNAGERLFGRYYEGPATPARILAEVDRFARENPRATRGEWEGFARMAVDVAYQEGWQRGYEHLERDPDRYRDLPDEVAAATPAGPELEIPIEFHDETVEAAPMPLDPEKEPDEFSRMVAKMAGDLDEKAKQQRARTQALEERRRHRGRHD